METALTNEKVVMVGLPESGKTTFLAALWHVVNDAGANTALRFAKLLTDDVAYLNDITRVWRSATKQERTKAEKSHIASMNLEDRAKSQVTLTFPDMSGESFQGMWERRECEQTLADLLTQATAILFFINSYGIKMPIWIADINELLASVAPLQAVPASVATAATEPAEAKMRFARDWEPEGAPTQVQIVELLQFLISPPFGTNLQRLAIVLSAWDTVKSEGTTPDQFLAQALPLVHQYLTNSAVPYQWRTFGVSAQGGDFGNEEEVKRLRGMDDPSQWIEVQTSYNIGKDLTIPLSWLRTGG